MFFSPPPRAENGPSGTQLFFHTAHSAIENATDFGSIVVDAKLVGSAFNSGGKIEPVAPLGCMHTPHPINAHVETEICAPIVHLELIPPNN